MKKQKTLFADVLETVTKYFLILVIVVVLFVLLSGIRVVESGNVAVVLRFGKLVGDSYEEQIHEPGLLFAFPYFIDEVIVIPSGNVIEQSVTTHYTSGKIDATQGGYLITGDQNIAVVSASVKYVVSDPVAYTTHIKDISSLINATVSTAMVNESASIDVDRLLTDGKDDFAASVMKFASEKLELIGAGVTITSLELTQVSMSEEVRTTYELVNFYTVQAETVVEQARQYRETRLPAAYSAANALISDAKVSRAKAVSAANTDLAEFWGVWGELKPIYERIYADNATAHGHAATVPTKASEQCAECEHAYDIAKETVYVRLYNSKYTAAIEKIGQIVVSDGDNKIILNP
ncbi:MAG: hypothetical protein IJY43_06010 [Clostridia bacterium]|nr:hypothetical protein [Clostridia bacterium]